MCRWGSFAGEGLFAGGRDRRITKIQVTFGLGAGLDLPTILRVASLLEVQGACLCCGRRSEEHTSELQSRRDLVCRLLLEKKKRQRKRRDDRSCDRGIYGMST